jgi:FAD/FMN-containing dehydrogenase
MLFTRRLCGLGLVFVLACAEPAPLSRTSQDASAADVGAPPRELANQAASASAPGQDPTAPSALSGAYRPLSAAYSEELAELVAYQRSTLWPLECPGLLTAGSCGDGSCDGLLENADNCAADCVPHLVGAYNDLPICPSYQRLLTPRTVAEIQDAVRAAVAAGQHVRPIGKKHSASNAICGDGVALDMSGLADVNATRIDGDIAYVQPGVTMIDFGDWLYARGLSIGYTHLGFRGVSVAGAIGTSAHGSSPVHNNALSQRVAALKLVLADGSVQTFTEGASDPTVWRALITSLGLLGVVVEVGVRVEPAFKLAVEVTVHEEAELLAAGPFALLEGCAWGQFNWFPGHRKFLRWCGKVSGEAVDANANNVLLDPGVSADLAPLAKTVFHAGTCSDALNDLLESTRFDGLTTNPPLLVDDANGEPKHVTRAVGPAHRLTSANLIALGKNKYFQMDWEVAIPQQYAADALRAARAVFDAHSVSLPGVGAFLRFGKIEKGGWLSYHSAGKEFAEGQTALFFETPVAVPVGYTAQQLDDYLHIYQGLIGLFVRHFGARAHWGKNRDQVFELQRALGTYDGRIDAFNEAVAQLDPTGVFANDFARRIGVVWPAGKP